MNSKLLSNLWHNDCQNWLKKWMSLSFIIILVISCKFEKWFNFLNIFISLLARNKMSHFLKFINNIKYKFITSSVQVNCKKKYIQGIFVKCHVIVTFSERKTMRIVLSSNGTMSIGGIVCPRIHSCFCWVRKWGRKNVSAHLCFLTRVHESS